jgi:hypothetical protein
MIGVVDGFIVKCKGIENGNDMIQRKIIFEILVI